jgi:glutamate-1-semialdehyde 2,1-aminomutase
LPVVGGAAVEDPEAEERNEWYPVATAAGIATLKVLRDDPPYERLEMLSAELERALRETATDAGISFAITRVGSMLTFFFNSEPPRDWDLASQSDTAKYAKYFWHLLDRGIYMPCSQYEALFVSAAHTEVENGVTRLAAFEAFDLIRAG